MARRSLVKDAQAAIKQLDTISRLSFLEMLHVEDKTKTNEPKKKKHTSPVSSRRSSIESIVTPQDQVNDLSEHFLSMENAYEDGESGDNRSTMTTTTTERLNASLAFSEADICLDRLRKQYTNLCAELGNLSSSREKKTDDCFELIREITEQIDRVWEILSRYPAEIAEVLPRLQGLQGMKDQVLAALEIERFEGDQRNQ